ncbi:MAG: helix-turn-helix transcriptional regulator [Bacteroidetes bacterium]|nr:helix-turn-helix transcriptional regulator [Bacteroidota bacterium]
MYAIIFFIHNGNHCLVINVVDKKFLVAFGKNLKSIRKNHILSQAELAADADLTLSQIARIETGRINTTICTVKRIAKTLKVDISDLFKF